MQVPGPSPQEFLMQEVGGGVGGESENLHFYQVPSSFCCSGDHAVRVYHMVTS